MFLVKEKDGNWKLCVDFCALNTITIKYHFSMPTILMDNLGGVLGLLNWICNRDSTGYTWLKETFIRHHFRPTMGIMNIEVCPLVSVMCHRPSKLP